MSRIRNPEGVVAFFATHPKLSQIAAPKLGC